MATEIVKLCDYHLSDEGSPRLFATHGHAITLDGVEYAIDLCDECDAKLFDPLASFVALHAAKVSNGRPRKSDADLTPEQAAARARKREMDRARRADHRPKPRHADDDGQTLTCPVCGFVAATRFGLAAHAHGKHEVHGLSGLFDLAASTRTGDA
jgi:hypothetical protein